MKIRVAATFIAFICTVIYAGEEEDKALVQACKVQDYERVRLLLEENVADPSYDDYACLEAACNRNDLELVKMLVADGRVNGASNNSLALGIALLNGNFDMARFLLENGADPSSVIEQVSRKGHVDALQFLLDNGANPSVSKNAALWVASLHDNYEAVKFLLSVVADPCVGAYRILHTAVVNRRSKAVEVLLNHEQFMSCITPSSFDNLIQNNINKKGILKMLRDKKMDVVRLPGINVAVSKLWANLFVNQFGLPEEKRNRLAHLLIRFHLEGNWTTVAMQEAINQLFS